MTGRETPSSACTRKPDEIGTDGNSSKSWPEQIPARATTAAAAEIWEMREACAFRVRVKCITDSACKNQLVVVSVQYGPFNPYITIRSTTIGKSRVVKDPIAMHTSWRSNSDIASVTSIGYPRMSASDESSTTMHRLLHASGSHPIPPPNDPIFNDENSDSTKEIKIQLMKFRFGEFRFDEAESDLVTQIQNW
ncbi:hypothetical protein F511_04244 [Dorcoceras hygrometricum]|nr:hypothetical protein F511_04244 [Dorcoceras hygrometricum]